MSVRQNFVFFLAYLSLPASHHSALLGSSFSQDHVPQEPSSFPPVTSAVLEPPAGWSVLPHVLRAFPWQPTKICWKSSWVVIFSFSVSFHVKERERCFDPLIHEHNPNKRNTPDSHPHQQIHRGVSEHRGCLRGWELPRSEPRLEAWICQSLCLIHFIHHAAFFPYKNIIDIWKNRPTITVLLSYLV